MEEAHDLLELKGLIARLGLRDDRRQSPRYNLEIIGNYHIDQASLRISQGRCWLVDISKEGLAIKIKDDKVHEGMLLHLQFLMDSKIIDITSKVVRIDPVEDGYLVGVQSLNDRDDIIHHLFCFQPFCIQSNHYASALVYYQTHLAVFNTTTQDHHLHVGLCRPIPFTQQCCINPTTSCNLGSHCYIL